MNGPATAARLPRILLLLLTAALVAGAFAVHPHLPERVASHFDGAGRPDGWSTRGSLYATSGIVLAGILFLAMGIPALVRLMPASLINVPNREYWLAPERREETHLRLDAFMAAFGCGTLVFFALVMGLVVRANISGGGRMSALAMWALFAAYFVFIGAWMWRLYAAFRAPPS